MSALPFIGRLGLVAAIAGSSASLAVGVGTEVDAARRVGFYSDTTPNSEYLGAVVGITEGLRLTDDGDTHLRNMLYVGSPTFGTDIAVPGINGAAVNAYFTSPTNGTFAAVAGQARLSGNAPTMDGVYVYASNIGGDGFVIGVRGVADWTTTGGTSVSSAIGGRFNASTASNQAGKSSYGVQTTVIATGTTNAASVYGVQSLATGAATSPIAYGIYASAEGAVLNYAAYFNAGKVRIADTTESTDDTTGALVVAGGVGIGGALSVGNTKLTGDLIYGYGSAHNDQTGTTYSLTASDNGKILYLTNAGAITLTLPQQSTTALPQGFQVTVIQGGAGGITLATEGSDSILTPGGLLSTALAGTGFSVHLRTAGAPNTWMATGSFDTGISGVGAGTTSDSTMRWDGSAWVENTSVLASAAGLVSLSNGLLGTGSTLALVAGTATSTVLAGGVTNSSAAGARCTAFAYDVASVGGNLYLDGDNNAASVSGAVIIRVGTGLTAAATFSRTLTTLSAQPVAITNNTAATSTTTGALRVTGGISSQDSIHTAGTLAAGPTTSNRWRYDSTYNTVDFYRTIPPSGTLATTSYYAVTTMAPTTAAPVAVVHEMNGSFTGSGAAVTSGALYSLASIVTNTMTGGVLGELRAGSFTANGQGNGGTTTNIRGVYVNVDVSSGHNNTNVYGIDSYTDVNGTTQTAYGAKVALAAGSGTVTGNAYTLRIDCPTANVAGITYGIYQSGTAALNQLAGSLSVGEFIYVGVQTNSVSANINKPKFKFTGSSAGQTLTLPAGVSGMVIDVRNASTVSVDVASTGGDTIEGLGSPLTLVTGESRCFTFIGTDWTVF